MLHLHRAERADVLVEALGDVLAVPLPDPLEAEVVSVPTRGVERWVTQRLAHRLGTGAGEDGVCANLEFPFPGRLVGDATAAAGGRARADDPWLPERAVWPLLEVLDHAAGEAWLSTVTSHIGQQRSRRFTTARHVADLFDRYGVHRPAMVRAWAAGEDVTASGAALPDEHRWQAELWRRLRAQVATASPAERLAQACAALVADPALSRLPVRFAIFGLTRLPASYLDVLRALATGREVHLFLLHPSPVLWDRLAAQAPAGVRPRADDPTAEAPRHPLLRSWGRDAREMQLVLTAGAAGAAGTNVADLHHPLDTPAPVTLLERLQQSVRGDAPPSPAAPVPLAEGDRSVQVHACHGRARQVEVVRDAILHLLADDPTLEPRDVIVMCPDIEAFAPLIHATFGAGDGLDDDGADGDLRAESARPSDLRVRLADRSLRQTNPVLAAMSVLLELAAGRVTSTAVLDLAGRDPVRRRFRFDDDDLARLKEWVGATAIRWGLDGAHRQPYKLANVDQNTWRAGLDRVLVGVTMAEEDQRLVDGVLPLDDVDSASIDLAGRFAELVDRLHVAVDAMAGTHPVATWKTILVDAASALLAVADRDAWQPAQLHRLLEEVVAEATTADGAATVELDLAEVRALLADRLRGQPTRANFRTGHLTFCTLVPMRSVPHRVVVLLGLDDTVFPRRGEADGDDLVAVEAFVGDGDGASEDRQLLLDALLAATDRLVITYAGRDERTNAERPPAVPVGELLDAVVRTGARRDQVVVHHPLQPFDPRNFVAGALGRPEPWSFDGVTLHGARSMLGDRDAAVPFLAGPLPPAPTTEVIELDALVKFVQHPVRAFLRQRLGISVGDFDDEVDDAIPVELDGLQRWAVGERVLAARLAGASAEACRAAEEARGELPPHGLAGVIYDDVAVTVESIVGEVHRLIGDGADVDSVEVTVRLDDGRLLVGTVAGIVGTTARSVTFSKIAAKHRAAAWVRFLALSAGRSAERFEVVTIGRSKARRAKVTVSCFKPLADDAGEVEKRAREHLHDLVALYDRGMREPLPVYCATSAAYAEAVRAKRDTRHAAGLAWESGRYPGEDRDLEHLLVHGGSLGLDALLEAPPCEGEDGPEWQTSEPSRFGRYARRFWDRLLDCEKVEHR